MVVVRTSRIPLRLRLLKAESSTEVLNWDDASAHGYHRSLVHDKPPGIWYGFKTSWLWGIPESSEWIGALQNDSSRCIEERLGQEFTDIGCRPFEVRLLKENAIATLDEPRHLCAEDPNRILQLRDMRDCVAFGRIYHADARSHDGDSVWTEERYLRIDWKRVMKLYAGIEVPRLKYSSRVQLNPFDWLATWDVSSGVVWRGAGLIELVEVKSDPDAPASLPKEWLNDPALLGKLFETLTPAERREALENVYLDDLHAVIGSLTDVERNAVLTRLQADAAMYRNKEMAAELAALQKQYTPSA